MELLVNKSEGNKVYVFGSSLGDKIWEPEPITRFKFKEPIDNDYVKQQLSANVPTAGIIFNGEVYIGTNDGIIYTPTRKIQRIPEIFVDPELFLDNFSFKDDSEKDLFQKYKEKGVDFLKGKKNDLIRRILQIDAAWRVVHNQQTNFYNNYLRGYLGIRGFVLDKDMNHEPAELYDGSILGISDTNSGEIINDLAPLVLHQVTPSQAGFVPIAHSIGGASRTTIENGIEKNKEAPCVDYHSLWNLNGKGRFAIDICPRDGSGYAPAKFVTDGETIGISHGNHPCYSLDILNRSDRGVQEEIESIDLDPRKTPRKLLIKDKQVFGDYGNMIKNFSIDKRVFSVKNGHISSISDSGLCTVQDENKTHIYNIFENKKLDSLDGEFVFLEPTPQN